MIISVAELKAEYLNISGNDYDDILEAWILTAQERIEMYCNTQFAAKLYQNAVFGGNGKGSILFANHAHVQSITTLYKRDDVFSSWVLVAAEDYTLTNTNGVWRLWSTDGFTNGDANYKITYTAGTATAPKTVRQVAAEMVKTMKDESEKIDGVGRLGVSSVSKNLGGVSENTTFQNLWETRWKQMLSPYRIPTV